METLKGPLKKTSSTKKAKKETIKQVLATPFSPYWPTITNEECKSLHEAFNRCAPIKEEKKIQKPHWKVLKEMTKEQRKQFQQSNSAIKKDYMFGVNEVTKSLEKTIAQAVLIASDVSPRLLVKHVVDMCIIKNVPVLVVPDLRRNLKQRFGLSSVVFGVKAVNILTETIKNIYSNYPVPEDHIHYLRMPENRIEKDDKEVAVIEEVEMEETETTDDVYLYRTSKSERVFKPQKSDCKVTLTSVKQHVGFLSLEENVQKPAQKLNYKALVVKRLKGNKDREKRKREIIRQNKGKV